MIAINIKSTNDLRMFFLERGRMLRGTEGGREGRRVGGRAEGGREERREGGRK